MFANNGLTQFLKNWKKKWIFYAFLFIEICIVFLPDICQYTYVLVGSAGLVYWLILYGIQIFIFGSIFAITCIKFKKITAKNTNFYIPIFSGIILLFFLFMNGPECMKVLKDMSRNPVKITIENYNIRYVHNFLGTSRKSSRPICYKVEFYTQQDASYVLIPLKAIKNRYSELGGGYPMTVEVYPNTGILANMQSLEVIRKPVDDQMK